MVLVAIAVVGVLGIPLGDPRFIYTAITLECAYIALAVLALRIGNGVDVWSRVGTMVKESRSSSKSKSKRSRSSSMIVTVPSIAIASMVIVANTLSTTHLSIMMSLTPLYNALILIVGGYVLQVLLIISSIYEYSRVRLADLNAR
ncbi:MULTISPECIES: hypothetical protein [Candidatus Nitrosocaldus]|jgi:hypothetical protein|nr:MULTISPECIES: hypothetical protein [Candidatus Nitrosocaldus]